MGVLSSLVSSLTAFYPKSLDPNRSVEQINGTIIRAIACCQPWLHGVIKIELDSQLFIQKNNLSYTEILCK